MAALGAFVVMVCRNEDKAERAKRVVLEEHPAAGMEIVLCDFSLQQDIHKAAEIISERWKQVDILINNHGFIAARRQETPEGIEETFAVNHLGYFLFTNLLLPALEAAGNARIVNVASDAHRNGRFDPENLQLNIGFTPLKAYGNSKLFNILFTSELAHRHAGTGLTANCLHPGVIRSGFGKSGSPAVRLFWKLMVPFMKTPAQGAETVLYRAASEEVEGVNGAYFANRKSVVPRAHARSREDARKLWQLSNALCGEEF